MKPKPQLRSSQQGPLPARQTKTTKAPAILPQLPSKKSGSRAKTRRAWGWGRAPRLPVEGELRRAPHLLGIRSCTLAQRPGPLSAQFCHL